jgi:cytochrome oxidase assembly protein ShyY1
MLAATMYGFLFERRWLIGLILILAIAAGCISLGFWQLRRLDEAEEARRRRAERMDMPVEPLTAELASSDAGDRRVEAAGRYDAERQIVLEARSYRGRSGRHLLTPLRLDDGTAVIVDRGWIPTGTDPSSAAPPTGRTAVAGLLLPGERRGSLAGKRGLSASRVLVRIDLDAIGGSVPYEVLPLWLLLEKQDPAPGELPVPAPLPKHDDPPHLSYAIQWFLFATIALVGYAALVRREARERSGGRAPATAA